MKQSFRPLFHALLAAAVLTSGVPAFALSSQSASEASPQCDGGEKKGDDKKSDDKKSDEKKPAKPSRI